MEECRLGKSTKYIRNFGKRIGSKEESLGGRLYITPERENVCEIDLTRKSRMCFVDISNALEVKDTSRLRGVALKTISQIFLNFELFRTRGTRLFN